MAKRQPPIFTYVAANVRATRVDRGLTQAELARRVRCTERYVQFIESGRANVNLRTLAALSRALKVPYDALLKPAELPEARVGFPKGRPRKRPPHRVVRTP